MNLETLLSRWRGQQVLALVLRALGVALVGSVLIWVVLPTGSRSWVTLLGAALVSALGSLWWPRPPLADRDSLARHLDRVLPELEDSASLIDRDPNELTGLERLQVRRVAERLEGVPGEGLWPRSQMVSALRVLVVGALMALLIWVSHERWGGSLSSSIESVTGESTASQGGQDLLSQVRVDIRPPAYTGLPGIQQNALDISAPEGSRVKWILLEGADRAVVVFAGGEPIGFEPGPEGIEAETVVEESLVYQIVIGGDDQEVSSPYARLVATPDEPPRLRFVLPQERVTTTTGQDVGSLALRIEVADDYGLEGVDLVTTLAQGSGEMVEFRHRRKPLGPLSNEPTVMLESEIDLALSELEQGSELYFYAEGRDRREPEANIGRSSTYILRIPAEEQASADLGEGLPIVMPPEYFRSQRQIIIDTEKLIAESDQIARSEFDRRSEELGFDQRALRMRYGTLLGEEFESGRPVGAGDQENGDHEDHEGHDAEEEEILANVPAELVHFHDSAEISTFFTSEIRTQLKQVLAQMWDAEGELRVHRPAAALPFEYRALALLKDLQQRSRLYVQKVGFETPPLEVDELRLTGDLDEIGSRSRTLDRAAPDEIGSSARSILAILEGSDLEEPPDMAELAAKVRPEIASLATRDIDALVALTALDLLANGRDLTTDESLDLERALWSLVPTPRSSPRARSSTADPLADLYRASLTEGNKP